MIRTLKVLFCDNEHGTGEVTFPEVRSGIEPYVFIDGYSTASELRAAARKEGWKRFKGADYCETCVHCMEEPL